MTTTVRQMLSVGGAVHSMPPSATVYDALRLMADTNVGAILVMEGDHLLGIFTERDYARKVVLKGRNSKDTPIGEVMTGRLVTIDPTWTADQCMALMYEQHIRHLPVLEDTKVVGVISIRDAVHAVVDEQRFTIRQLENYIQNS
ncbi:MAG: CBS domain-containing protein [Acidobacteria bacterium]|nr:CBS domain-containing protein [Acidobacteriota bacterium]